MDRTVSIAEFIDRKQTGKLPEGCVYLDNDSWTFVPDDVGDDVGDDDAGRLEIDCSDIEGLFTAFGIKSEWV